METVVIRVEKFFLDDIDIQNKVVNVDLLKYKDALWMFGRKLTILVRSKNDALFFILVSYFQ